MIHQRAMDIKSEFPKPLKNEEISSVKYNHMESGEFTAACGENILPIDLSRRRDSVETRKTPSPYNSSNFGGSSPSLLNDSPSTATVSSNNSATINMSQNRSDTPTHHYQTSNFMQHFRESSNAFPSFCLNKRESPSLPENMPHRYIHEPHVPMTHHHQTGDELNPYILHAVALQQKLQNIPAAIVNIPVPASPEISPSSKYPMVLGRDGKLSRPFKAYPRDPLSISASIPTSDSMLDRISTEKFNAFRKEVLEQIHAANGGHPTISNPKMRRTSAKSFVENISATAIEHEQSEQQRQQCELHHHQQQQLEAQNHANLSDSSSGCGGSSGKGNTHKDSAYFERRKKNNAAAKKSRDRRRMKEDEIAIRAAYLERENIELKIELSAIKRQLSKYVAT